MLPYSKIFCKTLDKLAQGNYNDKRGRFVLHLFLPERLACANLTAQFIRKGSDCMIPLPLANQGVENIIRKVGGSAEVKKHLEDLGFTVGGSVTVVNKLGENVIVKIKDSRLAINEDMARKIMV